MKRALTLINETLKETGALIICCVHDELLVETSWAHAPEVADTVAHHMKVAGTEFLRNVPLDVDVAIASSWAGKP